MVEFRYKFYSTTCKCYRTFILIIKYIKKLVRLELILIKIKLFFQLTGRRLDFEILN